MPALSYYLVSLIAYCEGSRSTVLLDMVRDLACIHHDHAMSVIADEAVKS